jgi:hypothetical protein
LEVARWTLEVLTGDSLEVARWNLGGSHEVTCRWPGGTLEVPRGLASCLKDPSLEDLDKTATHKTQNNHLGNKSVEGDTQGAKNGTWSGPK